MSIFLRLPHQFLRRHLETVERVLVALGLTGLLYGLFRSLPVYPANWDAVILGAVFIAALWSPPGAYFLAVVTALYPLYALSLYVAVLFLVVALLGQRLFIQNLGATVLVLTAPWLGRYHLAWAIPLVGGLFWGKAGGIWMGVGAALWGQIAAGMAGLSPDWLALLGTAPNMDGVAERFGQANSLETLQRILEPLAPNATALLYHLLQIALWALVGGIVGGANERDWAQKRGPWGSILIGTAGALTLGVMHITLGLWLDQYNLETLAPLWTPLFFTTLMVIIIISVLEIALDFLEHPLPPPARQPVVERSIPSEPERAPLPVPAEIHQQPVDEKKNDSDLIMLELD